MAGRKGKSQSNARKNLVSSEILEKASALFAERGFASTSLQDVADGLGISRTSLYHYIGGKEELLGTLVRGLTQPTAENLAAVAGDDSLGPVEKLDAALTGMVTRIATNPARFRLLLLSEGSLPEQLASEHAAARRDALNYLTGIIKAGTAAGALRVVDERVAAFALLGMCNWVAWWYDPDRNGALDVDALASEVAALGVASLRAPAGREPTDQTGVEHAVDLLGQDLAYLRRALEA